MKWLIRGVVAVVALVVLLLAVGMLLPSQFKVQRTLQIAAPADRVYALIADPREWKRWSVWNQRDPNMQVEYSGSPAGAGARWSWRSDTEGQGAMHFTDAVANERIVYQLSFPEFGMRSTGVLALQPAANGVNVTWTNEGDMGSSPVNRWFGVFMDRLVGPDFEAGLANLKRLAEAG
jgi:uncharacterized protein YndB with AHSA1/START domain